MCADDQFRICIGAFTVYCTISMRLGLRDATLNADSWETQQYSCTGRHLLEQVNLAVHHVLTVSGTLLSIALPVGNGLAATIAVVAEAGSSCLNLYTIRK